MSSPDLLKTPLHELHLELGARMVPFAGYDMPVQYPTGILAEHLHTRSAAGLFDVSHMGQAFLEGPNGARRFETLAPTDIGVQPIGRIRYTQLLNESGGILDDLMVARRAPRQGGEERLFLVVNAARKDEDFAHIRRLAPDLRLEPLAGRALIALQGPKAAEILARTWPRVAAMPFMTMTATGDEGDGIEGYFLSRSGYTGEDGFEISLPAGEAAAFVRRLLEDPEVRPIGLGARDSLRLEAGLCLYGHDIDETTSPIEAGLSWSIPKRRREEGGFPGAERILREMADGPARRRVGLRPDGKAPAREGADIVGEEGRTIGRVTSGGFGPSVGAPIAMGYVESASAAPGGPVALMVRGKPLAARVAAMPFHPHAYFRGP
ncbi:MAG TPA: glycine cleavage system aminomethyltransferase GcvT [Roseiarcus sp.]|nr:glycine cleavage system aminomethyltransferase GcvT [Roseiarcus sp.]